MESRLARGAGETTEGAVPWQFKLKADWDGTFILEGIPHERFAGSWNLSIEPDARIVIKAEPRAGKYISVEELGYFSSRAALQLIAWKAQLFLPRSPLTLREMLDIGPGRCWRCSDLSGVNRRLSFEGFDLGCSQGCRYYVCCGFCLCDNPDRRRNWLNQPHPGPGPGSQINPFDRAAHAKAAKWLSSEIDKAFPLCPLFTGREPEVHLNKYWSPDEVSTRLPGGETVWLISLDEGFLTYDGGKCLDKTGTLSNWPFLSALGRVDTG